MRAIYIVAAVCYAVSMAVMLMITSRPARTRAGAWQMPPAASLHSGVLLGLVVFAMFLAMYLGQPLAPNFLQDTAGWSVERLGLLGSLNALGVTLLAPALGRWGAAHRRRGLWVAQSFVWMSLGLLLIGAWMMPAVVFMAYFMRGGYSACRSLTSAQIAGRVSEENRGAAFGLSDTAVASAQMAAPYIAGWLYNIRPAAPILAGLVFIPMAMLLTSFLSREATI
jgi:MFS family permease